MNPRHPAAEPAAADAGQAGGATHAAGAASADVRQLLRAARRRRHARWLASGLAAAAVVAILAVLVRTGAFDDVFPVFPDEPAVAPRAEPPPAAAAPSGGPMYDPTHPFGSTPAVDWANGAAGIRLPRARPVNGFGTEQVAAALERVRDTLVASRLDRSMVVDHDPAGYLELLAPDARRQLEPLFTSGSEPAVESLVSLAAKGTTLLPAQAKVNGRMSVTAGEAGELVIHTNYVFVYAFEPAKPVRLVDAMSVLVLVRADVDYVMRTGDRWAEGSRGLWYDEASGGAYSISCEAYRNGFLAPAATERAVTANQHRSSAAYFDPAGPQPPRSCPA